MKKVFLMAVAVAAMTLASCGGSTKQGNATDSVETADSLAAAADGVQALTRQIADKLQAGDAQGVADLLTLAKEQIATLVEENPEQAKEYVSQLQQYIKDNSVAITELADGNATVTEALNTVQELDPETVVNSIADAVKSDADNTVNTAKESVEQAVDDKVNEAKESAKTKAADAVNKAADAVNNAASKAIK